MQTRSPATRRIGDRGRFQSNFISPVSLRQRGFQERNPIYHQVEGLLCQLSDSREEQGRPRLCYRSVLTTWPKESCRWKISESSTGLPRRNQDPWMIAIFSRPYPSWPALGRGRRPKRFAGRMNGKGYPIWVQEECIWNRRSGEPA